MRLNIDENNLSGYFYFKDTDKLLYIEKLKDVIYNIDSTYAGIIDDEAFIVYDAKDAVIDYNLMCSAIELDSLPVPTGESSAIDYCTPLTLEIATDADFEFWSKYGNKTNERILGILNLVEGIYSANFNLLFSVTHQNLYTNSNDPYTANDARLLVKQVRTNWNNNFQHVDRDIAHLFTGRDLNGLTIGVGFVGAVCRAPGSSYGLSQDFSSGLYGTVNLTSHEIGHNFDGKHADGVNCGSTTIGSIMCVPPSQSSFFFSYNSRTTIANYIENNNTCFDNNSHNVSGDWVKTWRNERNKKRIGTWFLNNGDQMLIADFNGDGIEELMFISHNASWATLMEYRCDIPSDWYHKWSNMGNNTISTWYMNVGDEYFTGDFDGDGSDDLLSISASRNWATVHGFSNGSFNFKWSNMGNRKISTWYINHFDKFIVGDFDGDGKDELLSMANNGYATLIHFDNNTFTSGWSNLGSGFIGGVGLSNSNVYRVGDFHNSGKDDLFTVNTNWATFLSYDVLNNNWLWGWSNFGSNNVSGWSLPLAYNDYILPGNIDSDQKEELMFLQSGNNASWITTMDFNSTGNLQWNWSNYGNGFLADWNQQGHSNYFLVKNNPLMSKQLIAIKSLSNNRFRVRMYRTSNPSSSNFRVKANDLEISQSPKQDLEFTVAPNPSNGNFIIRTNNSFEDNSYYSFVLYDLTGKVMYSFENYIVEKNLAVDVSNLSDGIYIAKINYKGKVSNFKVIIKK